MVRRLLALMLLVAGLPPALADVTPELQRQIRVSTFEVVMKKPAEGSVTYEKPLPLDLLPFVERTDPYRSVGTAFAIGPNLYVTAAHVLAAGIDSQFGAPALRATDGSVHPIGVVRKFSASEDFVVFSLADALKSVALPPNRSPHVDDVVLAVGNALGDGIVIRSGLFTSETAEEQDGRWKWIRFSAAASPGNSGGPLLDGAGNVIGVVIAKSPNENLNYALPIANVLDAPESKARFDQRALVKLPFAQGSQTYTTKDEFALPLEWEKFTRAYQALIARHSDEARAALLSAIAPSLFPKGSGSEAILYGSEAASRTPALVIQQADGSWTIQAPEMQFTDLPGDGTVGIAAAAGAGVLALHRGAEAADDAFYMDSKAFMDIALKALNVRRAVGTDQVRVTSVGSAVSDVTTTDSFGRKWQLRVWPLPYLDAYMVAQLLPTPDGYVGLIEYSPSIGLREIKAQLSLLANQVTLTYLGTIRQWQAFLARTALLPESLRDVKLAATPWALHTPRFDLGLPPELFKADAHSELLLSMNYAYDGPRVVWGIGGAWWYRDAQEKAYLGLWRAPRPPASVKLETRTRFDDLQARRSPYDGIPVRATSDAIDVQFGIQAPGTKDGVASSGVAYGLSLRLDGRPTQKQVLDVAATALKATHVLEHGIGPDVAQSAPGAVATQAVLLDSVLQGLKPMLDKADTHGKDIRNRVYSDDFRQYLTPVIMDSGGDLESSEFKDLWTQLNRYWNIAPAVVSNRDLWKSFLAHNGLAENTPHHAEVLAAERTLQDLISKGGPPSADWTARSEALVGLYVTERGQMTATAASARVMMGYRARTSACPAPADHTSGDARPRMASNSRSLTEIYPQDLVRAGLEGSVMLSLKIDGTGCVTEAAIAGSSGSDEFDEAALTWAETAAFVPGERDGKPIATTALLPVAFKLN